MILVTGGAGFIGSNFVIDWLAQSGEGVVNLDKLTYAGNLENLSSLAPDSGHVFIQGDIGASVQISQLLAAHQPRAVVEIPADLPLVLPAVLLHLPRPRLLGLAPS